MNQTISYGVYSFQTWSFYIAWVDQDIVFVGSSPSNLTECMDWLEKLYPQATYYRSSLPESMIHAFNAYFQGEEKDFPLSIRQKGTDFQKLVWSELDRIPFGETRTYGEVAQAIGKPLSSARAVGTAIGKNPTLILCPCHRVVPQSGKARGFRGGLEMKQALLHLENTTQKIS